MTELKKIKKISLADTVSLLYAVFAFLAVFGIYFYLLISSIIRGEIVEPLVKFFFFNLGLALLFGIFAAFAAGIIGWILGFLAAGFYNLFSRRFGGIKFELGEDEAGGKSAAAFAKVSAEKEKQELFKY